MSMRRTQRAPQSCSNCTKRKVKCTKVLPCTECLDRGLGSSCRREAVVVKGRVVNNDTPTAPTKDELQMENVRLRNRIRELEARGGQEHQAEIGGTSLWRRQ
ncbi:hypothetical protein I302_107924 [Kwoniella bestiolae CBS 10118]|uniref:Zn(2)-C6 fungal-type domain-containing protein n=1 Tax=Kwoniella bestiolae CBS 10118 TaxID=1296100 RepID=A0AAJ8MC08_9TREE